MSEHMKHVLLGGIAVVALTMGATVPGHAGLMISLDDGNGHSVTVADQSVGDTNPTVGVVGFSGGLGNFSVNVTTGISKPVIGTAIFPELDLNSVDVTSSAGGTLTLKVTDTDFIGNGTSAYFISQIGGTQSRGGTVTYSTAADCGNTAFGTGTPLGSQSFSASPFSGTQVTGTTLCAGNYSLTEEVVLTLTSGGQNTSFDANLAIPEPTTAMLFGGGLDGFGWISRRKTAV